MKAITIIFGEKTLKMLNALKPGWRETVMEDIETIVHSSLSDLLSANVDCEDCPISAYCDEHRYMGCEGVIYNYLENDYTDDTNAKKVRKNESTNIQVDGCAETRNA